MQYFQGQGERECNQQPRHRGYPAEVCPLIAPVSIPKYRWNSVCNEYSNRGHALTFCQNLNLFRNLGS